MRVDGLRSVENPDQNSASPCALSDGEATKVTRLEFRSSGVVRQPQGELLLRDFIATDPLSSNSHFTDFFAAKTITALVYRRLSRLQVLRTAKGARVFSARALPSRPSPQHTSAARDIFWEPIQKQHSSFTPSEPVLPVSCGLLPMSCTRGVSIERNSAREAR